MWTPNCFECHGAIISFIHSFLQEAFFLTALSQAQQGIYAHQKIKENILFTEIHGCLYGGHTLEKAGENIEKIIGKLLERFLVAKGYKGHKWKEERTKVFLSEQKQGVTPAIKRDIKRIIGHAKNDELLCKNYLKGRKGDEINAILSGIGFNCRQIISALALFNTLIT